LFDLGPGCVIFLLIIFYVAGLPGTQWWHRWDGAVMLKVPRRVVADEFNVGAPLPRARVNAGDLCVAVREGR
jgi:hypothetical protein